MNDAVFVAAVPWYQRETYGRARSVMSDGDLLPQNFDHWLQDAERVLLKAEAEGVQALRAYVDPDDFLLWCQENEFDPDSLGRLAYAEARAATDPSLGSE
jgi:hypothetical protein